MRERGQKYPENLSPLIIITQGQEREGISWRLAVCVAWNLSPGIPRPSPQVSVWMEDEVTDDMRAEKDGFEPHP